MYQTQKMARNINFEVNIIKEYYNGSVQ